ncbi:MAG: hypothetical protein ACK4FV_03185 [Candidatus Nitrosocaldus sp.]
MMRNYYVRMLIWMAISAAVSFILIRLFGLIIGLALSFAIFILLNILVNRRMLNYGRGSFSVGITYRCINCGHRFKGGSCPRCGSKMKQAEF